MHTLKNIFSWVDSSEFYTIYRNETQALELRTSAGGLSIYDFHGQFVGHVIDWRRGRRGNWRGDGNGKLLPILVVEWLPR